MKGTVTCIHTWNYEKDGKHRQGRSIDLQSIDPVEDSDGHGNATIGYPIENIYIPQSYAMDNTELLDLLEEKVEITYERKIGKKFDELALIRKL